MQPISKEQVRAAMKRVMSGKVVGQDDMPVVVERGQSTLTRLFNKILENERKPKEY